MPPALYFRDPNTGQMVPIIGIKQTDADARYSSSSGGALTGNVTVQTPSAGTNATSKSYADTALALPAGTVMPFAGTSVPAAWPFLICQGQAVARSVYPNLWAAIGLTYGVGTGGADSFSLPDMRNLVPMVRDPSNGALDVLNDRYGVDTVTLDKSNMPGNQSGQVQMHNTYFPGYGAPQLINPGATIIANVGGDAWWGSDGNGSYYHSHATANTGAHSYSQIGFDMGFGNQAHNNIQPYMALNYIIRY